VDYKVIIEIACTRTSEEFLAVKRSYQLLYKHCLEEDVASKTIGDIRRVSPILQFYYRALPSVYFSYEFVSGVKTSVKVRIMK